MAKFEKIIIENDENLLIKKFISLFKQKIRKKKKGRKEKEGGRRKEKRKKGTKTSS